MYVYIAEIAIVSQLRLYNLQGQIDRINEMINKLETSGKVSSTNNTSGLLSNLEGKLINLQTQLKEVREQRDKGTLSQQAHQENVTAAYHGVRVKSLILFYLQL